MGSHLRDSFGIDAFAIDQIQTVEFEQRPASSKQAGFLENHAAILRSLGGTAGFLAEDAPEPWCGDDVSAVVLSLENRMA